MAYILLVDDDQDLVEMNKTVLTQRGHTVLAAYSAAEARQAVRTKTPDLAVLDVMMEDKTAGFELARHLHPDTAGVSGTACLFQIVLAAYEMIRKHRGWQ